MDKRNFIESSAIGTDGSLLFSQAFQAAVESKIKEPGIAWTMGKAGIVFHVIVSMGVTKSENPKIEKRAILFTSKLDTDYTYQDYQIRCIKNFNIPGKFFDIIRLEVVPAEFLI